MCFFYPIVWDGHTWLELEDYYVIAQNIEEAKVKFKEKYPSVLSQYEKKRWMVCI